MHVRSLIGVVLALLIVVFAAAVALFNRELFFQPFFLTGRLTIPLWSALLLIFLLGFLPPAGYWLAQSLEQDLNRRRDRRRERESQNFAQRFRRAVDLQVDGQLQQAAAELETLLTDKPEDFPSLLRHGEVLRLQGKKDQALETHRRASVLYPHSIALLYQLAADYDALGETEVAREVRNRILRDFPGQGLEVMRRRRLSAMQAKNWDDALRWHDKIEALVGASGDALLLEREAEIQQGLAYQRGVVLLEEDRAAEAAGIFRKLIQQQARFVPAAIMLGEAELLLDNEQAALDEWRRGFKVTGSPVFLQRLEDYFIENEEPARAIESLRLLLTQTDKDLLVRFFLGRLYYRLEMVDEAQKVLDLLRDSLDASPTYHYLIGRIRQRRADPGSAARHYQTALLRLGLPNARFLCKNCGAKHAEWQGRCDACGVWNSIDLDLEDESLTATDTGVVERPIWGTSEQAVKSDAQLELSESAA